MILHDTVCCCCCCFSHSAHWLPTRKKLLYTVANPARGLLKRGKKGGKKVWQQPLPPHAPRLEKIKIKITQHIHMSRRYASRRYAGLGPKSVSVGAYATTNVTALARPRSSNVTFNKRSLINSSGCGAGRVIEVLTAGPTPPCPLFPPVWPPHSPLQSPSSQPG